jgi:hypothetical protein
MIYLIRAEGTIFYKIGVTRNNSIDRRLQHLQTGCPHQLVCCQLLACDNEPAVEKALHRVLGVRRVLNEWFAFDSEPDLVDLVNEPSVRLVLGVAL